MSVLQEIEREGHQGVYLADDPNTGLQAIIAIHDTSRGPALGGTRFWPYDSFDAALDDALRLSRAMTYKAAAANLDLGGGKAVIIGNPDRLKSQELLEAYGRAVDALGGLYITAEDVGTTVSDMEVVRHSTRHVTGLPMAAGGSGDPSPATAHGVLAAMMSAARHLWGSPDLGGRRVAVQGVGKVGGALVGLLMGEGCEVVISDVRAALAEAVAARYPVGIVAPELVLLQPCDILAPCALGGVIDAKTIPRLDCAAVVGSANDQLTNDRNADLLAAAGILYVPDFVVNAGGLINIAEEFHPDGYSRERAFIHVSDIRRATSHVLDKALDIGGTPLLAARMLAEERLAGAPGRLSRTR